MATAAAEVQGDVNKENLTTEFTASVRKGRRNAIAGDHDTKSIMELNEAKGILDTESKMMEDLTLEKKDINGNTQHENEAKKTRKKGSKKFLNKQQK